MPDMMYRCCKCGEVYPNESDAIKCEKIHQDAVSLVERKRRGLSHSSRAKYPHSVLVRLTDGSVAIYKFKEALA